MNQFTLQIRAHWQITAVRQWNDDLMRLPFPAARNPVRVFHLMPPDAERRSPAVLGSDERTTPAGRFASEPGHNDKGEAIVWVDYSASFAIHRLRAAPLSERRAARLASPATGDKRISEGCVVVPVAFYDTVISRSLGSQRGVVYVLPETRPARALFGAYQVGLRSP